MKTFVQLLGVAFWMLPVQRVLTLLGTAVILVALFAGAEFNMKYNLPGTPLPLVFLGGVFMLFTPLVAGGALFRIVSAPRAIQLLPYARWRLLAGMFGVVMLGTLLWIFAYWAAFQHAPLQFRPRADGYLMMYVLTLSFATQASISIFVASRGPLAALIVIGAWQVPGIVMRIAGLDDVPRQLTGPAGFLMALATWLVFGIWYLRAARIEAPFWKRMQVGAATVAPLGAGSLATRERGMERWVLGGSTPLRIGTVWLAAVTVLVGMQLLLGRKSPQGAVGVTIFSTLSVSFIVFGSIGWRIAARSRGLWLTGARSRSELRAWCERAMVRVLVATGLPFVIMGAVLWGFMPERPLLPGHYLLLAMLAPALTAAWVGLMQVQYRLLTDLACGLVMIAGMWLTLLQPMISGSGPRWDLLAAQYALVVVIRQIGIWRWRAADWPRNQRINRMV